MDAVEIRPMESSDSEPVAQLSTALGYETTANDVERRFALLNGRAENALFVAVNEGTVVGWVHVCGVPRLQTDGYSEIGAIAVAASHRRRGIGRRLLEVCERWGSGAGYARMRLRSGLQRSEAHVFYQRMGYQQRRASYAFERTMAHNVGSNAV
jgi:GNAT superfamily N-acetyltransferase